MLALHIGYAKPWLACGQAPDYLPGLPKMRQVF
jgi:hypothetical protein